MEATMIHTEGITLNKIRTTLFSIFFLFMPFTQALTFHVGFPLKISEVCLLALAVIYLATRRKVQLPKPVIYCIAFFFFIITVSFIINLVWSYSYPLKEYPSRFGYTGDSVTRYIYFILALLAFFISVDCFLLYTEYSVRIWLYGAVMAALYGWYLAVSSKLHLPVFLLPGMEHPPQKTDYGIIRCGTFLEGNYMGLYLLLSAGMSFYIKRIKTGIFLLLSIITTFSTLSYIGAVLFVIIYLLPILLKKKFIPALLILIIGVLFYFPWFTKTQFYKFYVYEKIFSDPANVTTNAAYSKADRLVTIQTAWHVSVDNPVFGVGLSNFSRHYEEHYTGEGLSPKMYKIFLRKNSKVIPNNIYVEILTEGGFIALITFIVFLLFLVYYARSYGASNTLLPALLGMLLCFNAYPSFIMIYLWCFMALPVAHFIKYNTATEPLQRSLPTQ
jgi:O-antigen ligase